MGAATPALVGSLVDIAMVAGKITATVDLENKLAQRNGRTAHAKLPGLDSGTEGRAARCGTRRPVNNALHRLIEGHWCQGGHLLQRDPAEICQLRRNVHSRTVSSLHSAPTNLGPQGSV